MQEKTKQFLTSVEEACRAKGQNFTAPRKRVLECLFRAGRPLKAYEIVEAMGGVKPMTVYRALDFLSGAGYAHRIESLDAYSACAQSHCTHTDSQYLICVACGRAEELHNHAIDDFIRKVLIADGFSLSHKTLELHGTCAQCAA
jgi:Fur family transcriptional regulator, zinc uptake regulator